MHPSGRCSRDKYQSSLTHSWQNIVGYIYIISWSYCIWTDLLFFYSSGSWGNVANDSTSRKGLAGKNTFCIKTVLCIVPVQICVTVTAKPRPGIFAVAICMKQCHFQFKCVILRRKEPRNIDENNETWFSWNMVDRLRHYWVKGFCACSDILAAPSWYIISGY